MTTVVVEEFGDVFNDHTLGSSLVGAKEGVLHCFGKIQRLVDVEDISFAINSVVGHAFINNVYPSHWSVGVIEWLNATSVALQDLNYSCMTPKTVDVGMAIKPEPTSSFLLFRRQSSQTLPVTARANIGECSDKPCTPIASSWMQTIE